MSVCLTWSRLIETGKSTLARLEVVDAEERTVGANLSITFIYTTLTRHEKKFTEHGHILMF